MRLYRTWQTEESSGEDYLGLDYETEKAMFVSGQTAMSFDGSWRIAELKDMEDNVGVFRMPYFTDREEFKTMILHIRHSWNWVVT